MCVCVCVCVPAYIQPRLIRAPLRVATKARCWPRKYATNNDSLAEHYAVTLMMIGLHDGNVQQNPVFLGCRIDGMNTSLDFCLQVRREGWAVPGTGGDVARV